MKKVIFLAVLILGSSAAAEVTISCGYSSWDTVVISYVADGNNVRALALDVTVSDGNIVDATNLSNDYYVHPGSVSVDGEGNISGSFIASDDYLGTLGGIGTGGITVEMASLYVGEANAPAASGDLFSFVVDSDGIVSISVNAIRGGVVMEDADEDPSLIIDGCIAFPWIPGDISDTSGIGNPDTVINIGDLNALLIAMMNAYPAGDPTGLYELDPTSFRGRGDIADTSGIGIPDNQLNIGDLNAMLIAMMSAYPAGDPTGIYLIDGY